MKLLKSLAEDGDTKTTIVASIHQPSSALYHSFNQVVLLANGRQLYFGPGGNTPAEFFASQGRPCPVGYNVADHLLEIASAPIDGLLVGPAAMIGGSTPEIHAQGSGSSSLQDGQKAQYADHSDAHFAEKGSASNYPPQALYKEDDRREVDLSDLGDNETKEWWPRIHCATTFLTQIEVLSGREWRNLKRYVRIAKLAILTRRQGQDITDRACAHRMYSRRLRWWAVL